MPERALLRVLFIEDSEEDALRVTRALKRDGYGVQARRVETSTSMQAALENSHWDVVIADYSLPHFGALEALAVLQHSGLDLPFIVISGTLAEEQAVSVLRAGAHDFILKDNLARLVPSIERELREAEQRRQAAVARAQLAVIVESSDDAIISKTLEGIITSWNAAAERLYGYSAAEAIGRPISMLAAPESPWEIPGILDRLRRGERVASYETVRVCKDGRRLDVSVTVSPVHGPAGQIVGASSIARDISERKRAEDALQETQQRLRWTLQASRAGAWDWDLTSGVARWSPEMYDLWGVAPGTVMETENSGALVDERDRDRVNAGIRVAIANHSDAHYEFRIHHAARGERWLETHARVVYDAAGQAGLMLGMTFDISERKQAEAALRSSEERFAKAFRASPAAVTMAALADGRFVDFNDRFLEITGYARDEVIGHTSTELGLFPDPAERAELVRRLQSDGKVRNLDLVLVTKNGQRRNMLFSTDMIELEGRPTILATLIDTTERLRAEEALRRLNAELETRVAARTAELRQSNERLTKAFSSNPTALTITRLADNVFLDVNEGFQRLFGYTREEVVDHQAPNLNINTNSADRAEIMQQFREHGSVHEHEIVLRTKAGELRHVLLSADRLDLAGEPHILTTILDITARKQAEAALLASEAKFRVLFDVLPVGVSILDAERHIVLSNSALSRILRMSDARLAAGALASRPVIRPDGSAMSLADYASMRAFEEQRLVQHVETGMILENGETIWLDISAAPLPVEGLGVVVVSTDVTERKQVAAALARERDLLQAIMDHVPDTIYFKDRQSRFVRINQAQARVLGLADPAAALGKTDQDFFPGALPQGFYQEEQKLIEIGQPLVDRIESNPTADGKPRWFSATKVPLRNENGQVTGMVGISRDITAYKQLEEQLRHLSAHDALTGLPNRVLLMDRLQQAFDHTQRHSEHHFAALFLDLDRFKVINDTLGHHAGDQVLITTAKRLQSLLRSEDTVARLGGDEFVVLLDDIVDARGVMRVAERIQQVMTASIDIGEQHILTAASIGIALSGPGYQAPSELLRDADTALYQAKSLGRGRISLFDSELHQQSLRLLALENDLRRAVAREDFRLFYQPIVSLATREVRGFEALLRWQHPALGLLQPAEFITLAEDVGVLRSLGPWILQTACRQAHAWQALAPEQGLTISVNLSASQFEQTGLLETVTKGLTDSGLEPGLLRLEITEQVILDPAAAGPTLQGLAQLGVKWQLDDFGTGYSSLSSLQHFPLEALKIDRSFLAHLEAEGSRERAVLRTIVLLAHELGLAVVAEGIETPEQADYLQTLGCEFGQGYWFGKPLASDAALARLRSVAGQGG